MMRDLVADYGTDAAEVDCIIGLRIEKRRLQDRCGKDDFVQAASKCIDQMRRSEPACAIDWPPQIGKALFEFPRIDAQPVAGVIVALDAQTFVSFQRSG